VGLTSGLDVSENPQYCSSVTAVTELTWMEAHCKMNVLETAFGNCVGARMNMVVEKRGAIPMQFNNCQRIEKVCVQVSSFVVYMCSILTVSAQAVATACRLLQLLRAG
jgi:hypothetical protein